MDGGQSQTVWRLGALLRRYRIAAGLTQEALAARSGVSVYSISNLERDVRHVPRKDTIELLADTLQLTPDEQSALTQAVEQARMSHGPDKDAAVYERSSSHVPLPPTPLIGREREVAALGALLHVHAAEEEAEATVRLLTLVGPPGVGKTRLALEVAHRNARSFREGVTWVNLAPLGEARLVAGAVAQALDIRQQGAEPVEVLIRRHLQGKDLLLLLDNFEHLTAVAPFLAELLSACPQIMLLVTSRTPVGIRAERQYPVSPLPLPDLACLPPLAELAQIPSVALFAAHAHAVQPDFLLSAENAVDVAAICCRLDGLPLAIELAAPRTRLFAPNTLLAHLDARLDLLTGGPVDLAPHQRALRTTLDWSYALLSPDAQKLFRRLAVFVGRIPLAGVGPVCAGMEAGEGGSWLLDHLALLVDHGLVFRLQDSGDAPCFNMLETIREFGLEQLHACGEDGLTASAHAAYYLALAETAAPNLHGSRHLQCLEWFEQEHSNLRAALAWALTTHDIEVSLRLAGALWRFWYEHGHIGEGRELLAALLRQVEDAGDLPQTLGPAWAKVLSGAGNLAIEQGDYAEATALFERALTVRRAVGDPKEVAAALNGLGMALAFSGALRRAQELLEESLLIRRQLGDREAIARALGNLGRLMVARGAFVRAAALYEESVLLYRQTANRTSLAMTLNDWAEVLRMQDDTQRAADVGVEGLTLFRAFGHTFGTAVTLETLGSTAYQAGDYERAMEYGQESVSLHRQLGHREFTVDGLAMLGLVCCALEQREQAAAFLTEALQVYQEFLRSQGNGKTCCRLARLAILLGQHERASKLYRSSLETESTIGTTRHAARCLEGLARIACVQGEHEHAARLEGAAAKQRQVAGTPLPTFEHAVMERATAVLRKALGTKRFASAWAVGQTMPLEQAIAEALKEADMAPPPTAVPGSDAVPEMVPLQVRPHLRLHRTREVHNGNGR